jgi:LCP family protein required for cell wall assembly
MLTLFARRVGVALVVCVVLAAGGVAGAYWFANDKWDSVENAPIRASFFTEEEDGEPANFLIIGSDSRAFVDNENEAERFGTEADEAGQRSDTLMVAHIDPDTDTGLVVSFPRDLLVEVPGRGRTRINAAFTDSREKVIETLKTNFDIPIHHYLEVDFAGFRELVNAVGGVPIYFATPARDLFTGLRAPLPACYVLNGDQALSYVRSRHYEFITEKGGEWREDPYSDLGRIARQQYFIRSLAQVAIETAARHPFKANNILNKAFASLTKDAGLAFSDVKALARTLRETDPAIVEMVTLPNLPSGDGATLVVDDAKAAPVLERLRSFGEPEEPAPTTVPEDVEPADVTVKVLNGSGVSGQARATLDALAAEGFQPVEPPADADRTDYAATEVRYAPEARDEALLTAAYLGGAKLVEGGNAEGSNVTVVVGRDFERVAKPGKPPPSTTTTSIALTPTVPQTGPRANPGQVEGLPAQPPVGCPEGTL